MAIDKPTDKPVWAEDDLTDPITGADNKQAPTDGFKLSGLKRKQPLPRAYLNYQFDNINSWINWIEDQINTLVLDGATTTLQAVYPVGSYYTSATATDPNTLFGFGTWARVKGRFIVGLDETDTDFDGVGEQGGSKTHTHTDNLSVAGHALTIAEMPSHTHTFTQEDTRGIDSLGAEDGTSSFFTETTDSTGGDQEHTHGLSGGVQAADGLPPYEAAYIWKRTA